MINNVLSFRVFAMRNALWSHEVMRVLHNLARVAVARCDTRNPAIRNVLERSLTPERFADRAIRLREKALICFERFAVRLKLIAEYNPALVFRHIDTEGFYIAPIIFSVVLAA